MCQDISQIQSVPPHDILCAGFPCQPFSIAGKRQGFEDARSNVFWHIVRILDMSRPLYIVLENVKNLKTHECGHSFSTIRETLTNLGYYVYDYIINTCTSTGIPQNRQRTYIVGFLNEETYLRIKMNLHPKPMLDLKLFLEPCVIQTYYYTNRFKMFELVRAHVTKHVCTNNVYQLRRGYVRENKSNVCPTLTANMGHGGHNVLLILDDKGIRK